MRDPTRPDLDAAFQSHCDDVHRLVHEIVLPLVNQLRDRGVHPATVMAALSASAALVLRLSDAPVPDERAAGMAAAWFQVGLGAQEVPPPGSTLQ